MKNQFIKRKLIYLVALSLVLLSLYQGKQLREMNKDYQELKEAYLVKTDTSFVHGLEQWKSGDELIKTLEALRNMDKDHNYDEARQLIESAKEEGRVWSRQLRDLIAFSEPYNPNEQIAFFRVNHLWLTSEKQKDLFMVDKSVDQDFMHRISYFHWQTKELDAESKRTLGELITHIQEIDTQVKEMHQQVIRYPFGFMGSQELYLDRQRFLERIAPSIEAIHGLAEENTGYIGVNTIISKNDGEQVVQVMLGVSKEELEEKTLKELEKDPNRQRTEIKVNDSDLYQQLKVGDKAAIWISIEESSGKMFNDAKIKVID